MIMRIGRLVRFSSRDAGAPPPRPGARTRRPGSPTRRPPAAPDMAPERFARMS